MENILNNMANAIGFLILAIIILFLLDILISMVKTMLGLNYKNLLFGAGIGVAIMAFRNWYKKNHVTIKDKQEVIEEPIKE